MHPSTRNEIEQLRAELARLAAILEPPQPEPDPAIPLGGFREPGTGLLRDRRGQVYFQGADERPYAVRNAERDAAHTAEGEATLAEMRQKAADRGLPPNSIIGWDGLPRYEKGSRAGQLLKEFLQPTDQGAGAPEPQPKGYPVMVPEADGFALVEPHPEEIAAALAKGQEPPGLTSELAEILRLRQLPN
jgi:hypothetical protein